MWVVYCTFLEVWVGRPTRDGRKLTVSTRPQGAERFWSREDAESYRKRLPNSWWTRCKVMKYAESTQRHNEYFGTGGTKAR